MKRYWLVIASICLLIGSGTVFGLRMNGNKGVAIPQPMNVQVQTTWDEEMDITVASGDSTITTGVFGDGTNKTDYYCRGLINNTAGAVDVYYSCLGDATKYLIHMTEGEAVWPLRYITKIYGTSSGTTAGTKIKCLFQDKYLLNGGGPVRTTYTE